MDFKIRFINLLMEFKKKQGSLNIIKIILTLGITLTKAELSGRKKFENDTFISGYLPVADNDELFYLMFDSRASP